MSDTYVVERSETIAAPPSKVYERVGNLERWGDFSPWDELDPEMTKTFSGAAGAVGSGYHWTGNKKVGEGRMTITDATPDQRVVLDLEFVKPFKSQSVTELTLEPVDTGTKVTWRMTGERTFMVKVMGLFGKNMDKMVGPDFEKGLANLKAVSEAS